jgi:hypothetical protein
MVQNLSESEGLDSESIQEAAEDTEQKASEMVQIYLGEDPDTSEALDFLGLAEGGEDIHYKGLNAMTQKGLKDPQAAATIQSILEEEKKHPQICIQLVKQNAVSSSS